MEQSNEYRKLQELIFTGDAHNIALALTMARSMGFELRQFYAGVEECVDFFESCKRQLCSPARLFQEILDKGLDLKGLDLEALPSCLWVLSDFCSGADLSNNRFFEFPPVLLKFRKLRLLNLSGNNLRFLPEAFWEMSNLEKLLLSDNPLLRLSPRIDRLRQLKVFAVNCADVHFLPEALKYLHLTELSLYLSKSSPIPDVVFELKTLKRLSCYGLDAEVLSESIGKLSTLEQLCIAKSNLKKLPSGLLSVKGLKILELIDLLELQYLPEVIFELDSLEELNLYNSPLLELSSNLRGLKNLKKINLKGTSPRPDLLEQWKKRLMVWLPDCVVLI